METHIRSLKGTGTQTSITVWKPARAPMLAMSPPQGPPGLSRDGEEDPPRASKRQEPARSGPEIKNLLELCSKEESLEALQSPRRNADIYERMAQGLAKKGHHPHTLDQMRAKPDSPCKRVAPHQPHHHPEHVAPAGTGVSTWTC